MIKVTKRESKKTESFSRSKIAEACKKAMNDVGYAEISKAEEDGKYNVKIHWGSSAFESYNWSMTAVSTGNGAELRYEDCTLIDLVFTSEEESTETVVYENGTGTFNLLSTYELVWNDETGHAADDTVFISVR